MKQTHCTPKVQGRVIPVSLFYILYIRDPRTIFLNVYAQIVTLMPLNYFAGEKYRHFVKLQNLIDLSYIQLTTNASIWPLFNLNENPIFIQNDPMKTCMRRFADGSLTDDVWVSTF